MGFESLRPSQPSLALRASFGWVDGAFGASTYHEASSRTGEGCLAVAALSSRSEGGPQFLRTCPPFNVAVSAYFPTSAKALRDYSSQGALARNMPSLLVMRGTGARFVYILRSDSDPARHYVGRTVDVDDRLAWHNHGPCGYTRSHRPWSVVVSVEFQDESHAARFERYLKSGSGRAFAKRHF